MRRLPLALLTLAPLALAACEVDVHDGIGPRVPMPNVSGRILREGRPADDLEIELRALPDGTEVAETETDASGGFGLVEISPGVYEVKVSGDETGDFDSITRALRVEAGVPTLLPEMDIHAFGAENREPADSETRERPSPFRPLTFRWRLPERSFEWARVQLYDADGARVWTSEESHSSAEAVWNGLGNEGDYEGERVPPGAYSWRMKFALPDSVEARSDSWELFLE